MRAGASCGLAYTPSVIARIQRLKKMEVEIIGEERERRSALSWCDPTGRKIFQSLRRGAPLSDGNVLRRHLRPAAIKLGLDPKKATWRSLRTSCTTWMVEAGANPKDVQGQMRHARISHHYGHLCAVRSRESAAGD
ncbi:MAG: hypothetical protein DMG64_05745 [Acidobacteria bacterium]|nr:MAG: hypothetical protein DMG64_05745 [Acidobacteriota bacterium]PYY23887.1 MAG: hypothetical protein DMG62_05375 [Acidobacteriota bacterium]